jgi:cation diffusion facilitator CzcD-associated flavoprotein CzcO
MKAFDDNGIAFECFEALPDVGGIWNPESPHAVYGSTHLNSSEKLTRYIDLWFPEGLPYYLSWALRQNKLQQEGQLRETRQRTLGDRDRGRKEAARL